MAAPRFQPSVSSGRKGGSWFMLLSLLVMAAAFTFLGLQMNRKPSHRTQSSPASAPAPAGTTAPDGGGDTDTDPNPGVARNG